MSKDSVPKVVNVPSPGDGRYWEQIQRNGKPEYVFYRAPTLGLPEAINYDSFHIVADEKYSTHYHPMKVSFWPLCGELMEPGLSLWDDVKAFVFDHVEFSDPRLYDVKTAWIMMTWITEAFNVAPYWRYIGTKNTGKTRALEVDQQLCYRATLSPSVTEAALYRLIEKYHVTYLLDETEIYNNEQKQATQHVLNAGYRRGQLVLRCEKAENGEIIIVGYDPFGPKALGGTRILKDTLESRCVPVVMERNTRQINFELNMAEAKRLRSRLLMWRFRRLHDLGQVISDVSEVSDPSEVYLEAPQSLHQVKNSRIVELFAPLMRLAVDDEGRKNIVSYAIDTYRDTQEEDSSGYDGQIINSIIKCHSQLESGKFSTRMVTTFFNEDKTEKEEWGVRSVGKTIKTLGFRPKRMTGGAAGYIYDADLVSRLSEVYDLGVSRYTSLGSLTSLTSLKIVEDAKDILTENSGELDYRTFFNEMNQRGHHSKDIDSVVLSDLRFKADGFKVALIEGGGG